MKSKTNYKELIALARDKRADEYKKLSSFTITQIEQATTKAIELMQQSQSQPVEVATIVFTLLKLQKNNYVQLLKILLKYFPTRSKDIDIFIAFVLSKLLKYLLPNHILQLLNIIENFMNTPDSALSIVYFLKYSVKNAPNSVLFCFTRLIKLIKMALSSNSYKVQIVAYKTLRNLVTYLSKTRNQQKHDAEIDFVKILNLDTASPNLNTKNYMADLLIITVYLEIIPNDLSTEFLGVLFEQLYASFDKFSSEVRHVALYDISLVMSLITTHTVQKMKILIRKLILNEVRCNPSRFSILALIQTIESPDTELVEDCKFEIIQMICQHKSREVSKLGIKVIKALCAIKPSFITEDYTQEICNLFLNMVIDESYVKFVPSIISEIWDKFRPMLVNCIIRKPQILNQNHFLIFISKCPKLMSHRVTKLLFTLCQHSDPLIRASCAEAIFNQYDSTDADIMEPIHRLLPMAHNDPDPLVRKKVLDSIPKSFIMFLTDDLILNSFATLIHDENVNVRHKAISLICQISKYNPFACLPILRKILLDAIFILDSNRIVLAKAESALPLPEVILAMIDSFAAYTYTFCDISLRQISFQATRELSYFESKAILSLNTTLINIIGKIAEVNIKLIPVVHIQQFHNFFLFMLRQHYPKNLKLAVISTMYSYLTNCGDLIKVDINEIFPALINIASMWKSRKLNIEVLKLIGLIGAIKIPNNLPLQTGIAQQSNHYSPQNLLNLSCEILLNIMEESSLLAYHIETVNALVQLFSIKDMNCDQEFLKYGLELFKNFFDDFMQKFDTPVNIPVYLPFISRICLDAPSSWVSTIGSELLELVDKLMNDPANEKHLESIFNLIPILVNNYGDSFILYISNVISYLLDNLYKCASENSAISIAAILALISVRSISHDYLFLIFPEMISTANSSDTKPIVKFYTLTALRVYVQSCNCSNFLSPIITCALNAIQTANTISSAEKQAKIIEEAQQIIYSIMVVFGNDSIMYHDTHIRQTFLQCGISLEKYNLIYESRHRNLSDFKFINKSIPNVSKQAPAPEPPIVNQVEIKQAFKYEDIEKVETPWSRKMWWNQIVETIIKNSPSRFVKPCAFLCNSLMHIAEKLFHPAFLSCWQQCDNETKIFISANLTLACNSESLPNDIRYSLVKLFEYMEQNNEHMEYMDVSVMISAAEKSFLFEDALYFASKLSLNKQNVDRLERFALHLHLDKMISGLKRIESVDDGNSQQTKQQQKPKTEKYFTELKRQKYWQQIIKEKGNKALSSLEETDIHPILAAAYFNLHQWPQLEEYVKDLPESSVSTHIINAIYKLKKKNPETGKNIIMQDVMKGFTILAYKAKAVFKHNNPDLYPLIVKAQRLQEVIEIVNFDESIPLKWARRLNTINKDPDLYNTIISQRMCVLSLRDLMPMIVKALKLYLKVGNFAGFHAMMQNWLDDESKWTPQIRFLNIKCAWAMGNTEEKDKQLLRLKRFVEASANIQDIRLLTRMYYTVGDWIIQNVKVPVPADKLLETKNYIEFCFKKKQTFYKACHRWSWANASLFKLDTNQVQCAIQAVYGFINSVKLREESFSDFIQMIYLVFTAKFSNEQYNKIEAGLSDINDARFLQISPQLFAKLSHHAPSRCNELVKKLILRLLPQHYHSLLYPLMLCIRQNMNNSLFNLDAVQIHDQDDDDNEGMEEEMESSPLRTRLTECRNEFAADILLQFNMMNPQAVSEAITISDGLISCSSTRVEAWFYAAGQAMRFINHGDFNAARQVLINCLSHQPTRSEDKEFMAKTEKDIQGIIERISPTVCSDLARVYANLKAYISHINHVRITDVSDKLARLQNTEIAVPGTYVPNQPIITISQFEPILKFFQSKQRPRMLVVIDINGGKHHSLLKGNEDLRLDERIMQFFGLINQHIKHDFKYKNTEMRIIRYSITPISPLCGLIQYVIGADTMFSLISEYRKLKNQDPFLELSHIKSKIDCNIDSLRIIQRYEVLSEVIEETKDNENDLRDILWFKSHSATDWVNHFVNFSQSSALMSIIGYILGLGDRHPSNLMIHQSTGSVIHVDFGDCFEVNKYKVKFPETIPFRLTRMIIAAFGPTRIEGYFRITCEEMMKLMRIHKDSIMAVLDIFLQEPLDINVQSANIQPQNDKSEQQYFNFEGSMSSESSENQRVPIYDSMNRVMSKISGEDSKKETIEDQVEELISEATCMYNLAHLYHGWTPLW